ncbi:MAG: flippase [Desulfosalsimonas sp.]
MKSYLIRGSAGIFALKVGMLLLNMIGGILLARFLGADGYGVYAYALALVTLMTIPSVAGLPQLIVRNVAVFQADKSHGLMRGLLIRANQITFLISLSIIVIALAGIYFYPVSIDPAKLNTFCIALLLVPLLALKNIRLAALKGLRRVILGNLPEMLVRPVLFVCMIGGAVFFLPNGLTPETTMVFQVTATAVAFALGIVFLVWSLPSEAKHAVPYYETRIWLKSGFYFMFMSAMFQVNSQTDLVMLGIFRESSDVGVYKAVVHASNLMIFILQAVNMALAPAIANMYATGDMKKLQRMLTLSVRAVLLITAPIGLILVFGGKWLLGTLFGPEFAAGFIALGIICIGQIIRVAMGSVGTILSMTGNEKDAAKGVTLAAIINVVLNVVLIPKYGLNGAATATATSMIAWNTLLAWWVFKKTGLNSAAFKMPYLAKGVS